MSGLFASKTNWITPPVLNITIITYIYYYSDILPGRPYTGPGFELGMLHLRDRYNFNVTVVYVGDKNIRNIPDLVADAYRVAGFYYKKWDRNGIIALIFPGTDDLIPIGQFARGWNIPMISTCGYYDILRNNTLFPTTFTVGVLQFSVLKEVFSAVFNYFNWTSISVIQDVKTTAPFYDMWLKSSTNSNIKFLDNSGLPMSIRQYRISTQDYSSDKMEKILRDASRFSRIFLFSLTMDNIRYMMLDAQRLGMTNGDYVYFVLEPFEQKRQYGELNYHDALDPLHDENAAEAFRSLLKITPCAPRKISRELEKFLAVTARMSADEYGFHYPAGEKPHEMVMAAYAGMEVYGQIIHEAMQDGDDLTDGRALVQRAFNRTFHLRFTDVFVDEYGERRNNYCVSDFNITSKTFENAMLYDTKFRTLDYVPGKNIDWLTVDNVAPSNEPRCGYSNSRLRLGCPLAKQRMIFELSAGLGCVLPLLIISLLYLVIRKWQKDIHRDLHWWKISHGQLTPHVLDTTSVSMRMRSLQQQYVQERKTFELVHSSFIRRHI